MDRASATQWAIDLLTGTLIDDESSRDPPAVMDPILRARTRVYRIAFPDLTAKLHHLSVDGEWVAVHAIGRAHHAAAFQGCPATGRVWSAGCTAIFQVAQNRVINGWVTWDQLSILEQLGAVERCDTVSA